MAAPRTTNALLEEISTDKPFANLLLLTVGYLVTEAGSEKVKAILHRLNDTTTAGKEMISRVNDSLTACALAAWQNENVTLQAPTKRRRQRLNVS